MAKIKGFFKGIKYFSQIFGNVLQRILMLESYRTFVTFQSFLSSVFLQLLKNMRWRLGTQQMLDMLLMLVGTMHQCMLQAGYGFHSVKRKKNKKKSLFDVHLLHFDNLFVFVYFITDE